MKDRDYEKATAYFKRASDLSPQTGKKDSLHKEAVDQFSTASVDLANQLITEGRYQQAQNTLRQPSATTTTRTTKRPSFSSPISSSPIIPTRPSPRNSGRTSSR